MSSNIHKLVIWNPAVMRKTWLFRTLGPYSIASWLRKAGVKAQVIEWADRWELGELINTTNRLVKQNGFVGVSSTFWGNNEPANIMMARKLLKQMRPDIKWVLGGARHYAAIDSEYDITVKGFGEDEAIKIFNHGIGQIWHPSLEAEQFHEGDCVYPGEVLPLSLGRGCRFKCKFCSYPLIGRKPGTYERTVDNLMLDWESRKKLGASSYTALVDDTINESEDRIQMLETIKKHDPAFGWGGYMRADLMWANEDHIERLPKSGLLTTFHGIETLHPKASMVINKGWSSKHAKTWLPDLYENKWNKKISPVLSFIIGLPGEPLDDVRETHRWAKEEFTTNTWRFCALTINRDGRDWPSEFDRDAEKYGYRFPIDDQPSYWESDIMNVREAWKLEDELNADPATTGKCFSGTGLFWALGLGATPEQLLKNGHYSPLMETLLQKQEVKFKQYVKSFKRYWNV